jgi:hypothetical protein|tara:strand:- start:546 stop:815 length:270 start_codon:yes stop_codon:yes gene_type:complete
MSTSVGGWMLPCFSLDVSYNMPIYWITIKSESKHEKSFDSFCEAQNLVEAIEYFYSYLKFAHFSKRKISSKIKKEKKDVVPQNGRKKHL